MSIELVVMVPLASCPRTLLVVYFTNSVIPSVFSVIRIIIWPIFRVICMIRIFYRNYHAKSSLLSPQMIANNAQKTSLYLNYIIIALMYLKLMKIVQNMIKMHHVINVHKITISIQINKSVLNT